MPGGGGEGEGRVAGGGGNSGMGSLDAACLGGEVCLGGVVCPVCLGVVVIASPGNGNRRLLNSHTLTGT